MIRRIDISWKRITIGLGIIALLIVGFVLYVNGVNAVTSSRAPYVTNTSCGYLSNGTFMSCPEPLSCYEMHDQFADGDRCAQPGYVEAYCGVLTNTLATAQRAPRIDCSPVYDPFEVLKRTPRVLSAISG